MDYFPIPSLWVRPGLTTIYYLHDHLHLGVAQERAIIISSQEEEKLEVQKFQRGQRRREKEFKNTIEAPHSRFHDHTPSSPTDTI